MSDTETLFQCPVCKLHYRSSELAKQCQDFCSANKACSLVIIQQSIENEKARLIHEN